MSSGRDMFRFLRDAIGNFTGDAKQRADAFEIGAKLIFMSDPSWGAARALGADGSHLFIGKSGDVIIFDANGRLYQGKLQNGALMYDSAGVFLPDYSRLKAL